MRLLRVSRARLTALLLPAIWSCSDSVEPEPVATVEISPATLTVEPGGSGQLTATARNAAGTALTGRQFSWTIAGPSIATVSQTGTVTGITDGTTTVSATAEGKTATASVTVRTPVATVVVTPPNATVSVGGAGLQLQASVRSSSGALLTDRVVSWSTSNAAVATVSATGNVTGVAAGSVTVTATADGRSGTAAITVENPCSQSRPILMGQTLSGTLSAADCRLSDQTVLQAFRLVLNSTETLEVQMTSSAVDPYLIVTDAQGKTLEEDDDGGPGQNARVLGTFSPGTYFILANTFDPNTYGSYQVSVAQAPIPCISARVLALPSGVPSLLSAATSCRLNDDRWFDAYAFSVGQISTVRFDLTSSAIDPALLIVDEDGDVVAQDDDGGTGTNARVEIQMSVGQYYAFVTGRPNQLGAYRLDVTPVVDPCVVTRFINPAQTQNSTLTSSDCAVTSSGPVPFTQRWGMTVPTNQALQIDMSSSIVDTYLTIQNATTGAVIAENDDFSPPATNSRISAFFPAGQYIINASTFAFGETGAYSLSVTPVSTTQPVTVTLAPNNLSLSSGQTQQMTATVTGNANTAVTWETSNSGVATVSSTGLVRGITPGSATITARAVVDPSKSASVTVTVAQSQTGAPNLDIAAMYLVQSVQQLNGSVKLVANRDAVARVFVRGSRTGIAGASVRVRVMQGTTVLQTFNTANLTPTLTVDESCCSANILIPAAHIRAGVSIIAEVDADNAIVESNESDNTFPLSGVAQPLNVTTVSDLNIRMVPIRQNRSGLTGSPTPTLTNVLRSLWPVATVNVTNRAQLGMDFGSPYDGEDWWRLVQELELVRRAESSNMYYYGVVRVNYQNGVTGMAAGFGVLTAVGVDESFGAEYSRFNITHELGHAMGLRHAPCGGAAGPDPGYPFQGGLTGTYGMDVAGGLALKRPNGTDIMGYCETQWVSAYNYNHVMDLRSRFPNGQPGGMVATAVSPVLLITGRVSTGQATLDGSFSINAQASIPEADGRFVLEGFDANGRSVFSHRFSPFTVHDARLGDEAFVVGVPLDSQAVASVARVEVRELNGARRQVRARADASAPGSPVVAARLGTGLRLTTTGSAGMMLVRNPRTGEVLAVTRSGTLNLTDFGGVPEVEVLVSDGVVSTRQRVNTTTGAIIR